MSAAKKYVGLLVAGLCACMLMIGFATVQPAHATTPQTIAKQQTVSGKEINVPVSLKKGIAKIDFTGGDVSGYCGLYSQLNENGMVTFVSVDPYSTTTRWVDIKATGTYFLYFNAEGSRACSAKITLYPYYDTENLSFGTQLVGTTMGNYSTYAYYKVTAPSRGLVTFAFADPQLDGSSYANSASVNMCSTSKSAQYTSDTYVKSGEAAYFPVKAGTYLIRVKTGASVYVVKASFKKATATPKTKKSKAATLKVGKTKTAVMAYGDKKTAWYKIKIKKSKKYTITLKSAPTYTGSLRFTVYGPSLSKYGDSVSLYSSKPSIKASIVNYAGNKIKIKKGTYYVKVESVGNGRGLYSIKWK